eukprot:1527042-Pleurochrysis_carterae.AAC.1
MTPPQPETDMTPSSEDTLPTFAELMSTRSHVLAASDIKSSNWTICASFIILRKTKDSRTVLDSSGVVEKFTLPCGFNDDRTPVDDEISAEWGMTIAGADGDEHEPAHAHRAVAPDAGCAKTGHASVTDYQGVVNNAEARLDEPFAAAPAAVAVDPGVTNTNTNACEGAPVDFGARDGSG